MTNFALEFEEISHDRHKKTYHLAMKKFIKI